MGERPRQTVSVGVARFDARGACVFANDRIERILGATPDQMLGEAWRELWPELESRVSERWDELRAGRSAVSIDTWERADGRVSTVQIESIPELDADGRVTSILLTCVDLSSGEGSVWESERQRDRSDAWLEELECAYARAPVGLAVIDRDLRYVRVNQAIADMNGLPIEEVVGKRYRDLAPETADRAEHFLGLVAERGQSVRNLEVRARPPGDPEREHVYLMSVDPMRNAAGEVTGLVAAVQDVTELRKVEARAARRLQDLQLVYANAPVGLCHVEAGELRVLHMNALFARLADRSAEELVGRCLPELLGEEIGRQLLPLLRQVARTGMSAQHVEICGRPPGPLEREYIWMASLHPARRDGAVSELIIVLQDTTLLAERLREIEGVRDRLDEAQRVAGLGSWEWNLLEDRVWWSPELYEIFGEPRSYVPSYTGFFEHVHPGDRTRVRAQIDHTVQDDAPFHLTYRIQRGDGAERVLFAVVRLERTPDGQPARLLGTCQDITRFGPPGRTWARRRTRSRHRAPRPEPPR